MTPRLLQRLPQPLGLPKPEAMKMQNTIGAPVEGMVEEVLVKPGDAVKTGQVLCKLC